MLVHGELLDFDVGREHDDPRHSLCGRAAWISAIDPPSLWPNSTGRRICSRSRIAGSQMRASSCMYSTPRGAASGAERP